MNTMIITISQKDPFLSAMNRIRMYGRGWTYWMVLSRQSLIFGKNIGSLRRKYTILMFIPIHYVTDDIVILLNVFKMRS